MRTVADTFHGNLDLEPEESFKVFLFISKALAAMGFLFVFGQVSATGRITTPLLFVLAVSAVIDIVPEVFTLRLLKVLPERARKAEKLHLYLKAVAYVILASILAGIAASVFWSYTAFAVLWLGSFLVEESVMFLSKAP